MFGKSKKERELEAELLAENPELSVQKESLGVRLGRYAKPLAKNLIIGGIAEKLAKEALKFENKKLLGDQVNRTDTQTYKNLMNELGKGNYGGSDNIIGPNYRPDVDKVFMTDIKGLNNSKVLAHEMGHRNIENGGNSFGRLMQRSRNMPILIGSNVLALGNAVHAGNTLAKDKILGKKSSWFNRLRGGGGFLLANARTLYNEADATIRGYKLYKNAGGKDLKGYRNKTATAYSTYLTGALAATAGGWLTSILTKESELVRYKNMTEVEKIAYLTKLLKKQPEYKGFSTKDLARVAYNRMRELDKEL